MRIRKYIFLDSLLTFMICVRIDGLFQNHIGLYEVRMYLWIMKLSIVQKF